MLGSYRIGVAQGWNQAGVSQHPDGSELGQIDNHGVLWIAPTEERDHAVVTRFGPLLAAGSTINNQSVVSHGPILVTGCDSPPGRVSIRTKPSPVDAHPVHQHPQGKVPYRENDRPVGAAVPEGMEGTMSSLVILFKTTAVVVDLQERQSPPEEALPGSPQGTPERTFPVALVSARTTR